MSSRKHYIHTVTEYLSAAGLLETGSAEQIAHAKKEYWKQYRKQWRKQQRESCKSYTIFLSNLEYKKLRTTADGQNISITALIKHRALNEHDYSLPLIIGNIREAFYKAYEDLTDKPATNPREIFSTLEQLILSMLMPPC